MSLLNGSPTWMYNAGGNFYPYLLNQSLRFNSADSAYLSRTPSSASNRKTFTLSCWVKRAKLGEQTILDAYSNDQNRTRLMIDAGNRFQVFTRLSNNDHNLICNARSRDTSSWYHVVYSIDTTQSTASNRVKIYINGALQTFTGSNFPDQNEDMFINSNVGHSIGCANDGGGRETFFDGYLSEMHLVDGSALTASSFGETKEGIWIPTEYTGSHGTNGFYLPFDDSSAIGDDESANTNDFSTNNISATDAVEDRPTNNFATMNSTHPSATFFTMSEGNLKVTKVETGTAGLYGQTMMPLTGKWYFEVCITGRGTSDRTRVGVANYHSVTGQSSIQSSYSGVEIATSTLNRVLITAGGSVTEVDGFFTALSDNDIVRFAVDMDNGRLYVGVNGNWWNWQTSQTGGDPTSGSGYITNSTTIFDGSPMTAYSGYAAGATTSSGQHFNFGQDSSFSGLLTAQNNADENDIGDFYYTPPTGYLAICSSNLVDPVIDPNDGENPTDYFNTILYSATANAAGSVTGYGFAPNFVWTKARNATQSHQLFDTLRGDGVRLITNSGGAESALGATYVSLENDGFDYGSTTFSSNTYVGWGWKAGGSPSSNSNGSITSSVSANTDAGFSIVSYTGNGGSSATIGHGLTSAPDLILLKNRTAGEGWVSFWDTDEMGPTKYLNLNGTGTAATSSGEWNNTAPTNTVFTIGNQGRVNTNTHNYIAYCFHNVEGYCKIGSWEGDGGTDGPIVYCGFRPAFVFMKNIDDTENWLIYDNKRDPFNVTDEALLPNSNSASGGSANAMDFLSNGFKLRSSAGSLNGNAKTFVFLAIADQPQKYANAK